MIIVAIYNFAMPHGNNRKVVDPEGPLKRRKPRRRHVEQLKRRNSCRVRSMCRRNERLAQPSRGGLDGWDTNLLDELRENECDSFFYNSRSIACDGELKDNWSDDGWFNDLWFPRSMF